MGAALKRSYDKPSDIVSKHWDKFQQGIPSLQGKVVAIIGCTTGTGRVLADACGAKGATIVLLNRASDRADKLYADLKAKYGDKVVDIPCDLMSFNSVRSAAQQVTAKFTSTGIDALVNNAGVMAYPDEATQDGYDVQMQTNHLSHFLLTKELYPLLQKAAESKGDARIVNHSSIASGMTAGLKAEYFGRNGGNLGGDAGNGTMTMTGPAWERYAQTKLANAQFTFALRDKLAASGSKVKAVAAHPGVAATELQVQTVKKGNLSAFTSNMTVSQSAEDGTMGIMQGVAGPVASGDIWGPGGMGFAGEIKNLASTWEAKPAYSDPTARAMLWTESEKATGCEFKC